MSLNLPVITGVDGSDAALVAVRWAAVDAARQQVPLRLVSAYRYPVVYGPPIASVVADNEADRQFAAANLEQARVAALQAARDVAGASVEVSSAPLDGLPIPALLEESRQARLLVVSTRGRGAIMRGLFGSVSSALTSHAHCPVAVIPDDLQQLTHPGPVVVGVDGSEPGQRALEIAFDQASRRGTGLIAVHAWENYGMYRFQADIEQAAHALLAESLAGFGDRYPGVVVRDLVVQDRPARAILEQAPDAALVVVGSRGRGGFAGLALGSTSRTVLHRVTCPVIVAR